MSLLLEPRKATHTKKTAKRVEIRRHLTLRQDAYASTAVLQRLTQQLQIQRQNHFFLNL